MCKMNTIEDTPHFILVYPYLDGARYYALLLWHNNINHPIYNMFSFTLKFCPSPKMIKLLLDPVSMFYKKIIKSHINFASNSIQLAQDFLYSLHRKRNIFY